MISKICRCRRGIVGIEAAIVMIAFIVVAAALSYVVINMGFFTTQKTKEAMASGLDEALAALQLDGVVTGKANDNGNLEWVMFPTKLASGRSAIDLNNQSVVVSVYLPNATLLNIYNRIYLQGNGAADFDVLAGNLSTDYGMNETDMAVFVVYNGDGDTVLETTEKAFLIMHLNETVTGIPGARHTVADYEVIKIEVKASRGAALTIVRTAPGGMLAKSFVDLG